MQIDSAVTQPAAVFDSISNTLRRRHSQFLTKTINFHIPTASFSEIFMRRRKFIVDSSRIKSLLFPGRWIGRFPGDEWVVRRHLLLFFRWRQNCPTCAVSSRSSSLTKWIGKRNFADWSHDLCYRVVVQRHVLTCLQQEVSPSWSYSNLMVEKRGVSSSTGVNNNPVWTWFEVEFSRS